MRNPGPNPPLGHAPLPVAVKAAATIACVVALAALPLALPTGWALVALGAALQAGVALAALSTRGYRPWSARLAQVGGSAAALVVGNMLAGALLASAVPSPGVRNAAAAVLVASLVVAGGRSFFLAPVRLLPAVEVGQIWWAAVPFEEGAGFKDRPVLIVGVSGRRVRVHTFTSVNQSGRAGYAGVGVAVPGSRKASWLRVGRTTSLRTEWLRAYGGPAPAVVLDAARL